MASSMLCDEQWRGPHVSLLPVLREQVEPMDLRPRPRPAGPVHGVRNEVIHS